MSGRVDAQKEVVKERVGEDRCNVQVLCFQSCSVCRFFPVEFPAPLDNMVQCDVTIARGNVSFTPDALIDCAYVEKVLVKASCFLIFYRDAHVVANICYCCSKHLLLP